MGYYLLGSLIALPLLMALCVYLSKGQKAIARITRTGAGLIIALSITFCVFSFCNPEFDSVDLSGIWFLRYNVFFIGAGIALYIFYIAVKKKSMTLGTMSVFQLGFSIYTEFFAHKEVEVRQTLYVDKLTLLFILIIGIIGGLICIYAVEYMKDYHRHEPHVQDRRSFFISIMFVFLAAMFGIVISNQLSIMLMFWEITSLCSFLLIGYNQMPGAVKNSMQAIKINVFGGILFLIGMFILQEQNIADLRTLIFVENNLIIQVAVMLIAVGALTKAAQFPFSPWLLGAMAAPAPSSALLHSSTMVKAGIFLLLRLAPMLGGDNPVGVTVTTLGGVTFFISALMAVSQTDSKRVLAHSTVSNLGLIVACVGINTTESIWAAVMLTLFHAIAKSLLFLAVGSATHQLDSRDIEAMDGLIGISKTLTVFFIIGIAGMFLAPFGMLVSKWAAMKAFLDSNNVIIVLIVAFGSTVTLFFWTKWLGKLIANAHRVAPTTYRMRSDEKVSMFSLAGLVIIICTLHPFVSDLFVIPYIQYNMVDSSSTVYKWWLDITQTQNAGITMPPPIDPIASWIIVSMIGMIFVLPLVLIPIYRKYSVKKSSLYLSGLNAGDDENFHGSFGELKKVELRNWYMQSVFGEDFWYKKSVYIGAGILIAGFFAVIGGAVL